MKKITATKVKRTGPAQPKMQETIKPLPKTFGKVKPITKKNDGSFKVAPMASVGRSRSCC